MTQRPTPSRARWRKSSYSSNGGDCIEVAAWRTSSYTNGGEACVEVGVWNKSSHSTNGGNCVEVGLWSKSTYSGNGGDCVEVTALGPGGTGSHPDGGLVVGLRDSKDPGGPRLYFTPAQWAAFARRVRGAAAR